MTPQQLGKYQLSITVNGESIQSSPFSLNILPAQRNYTHPVTTIFGIRSPRCIAFSDDDMFVTSSADNCIHVYDTLTGNKKATIGSEGSDKLEFKFPFGIDICGKVVYVAECKGCRIHMFSTKGKYIRTFGEKGSGIGQFIIPFDVKIN